MNNKMSRIYIWIVMAILPCCKSLPQANERLCLKHFYSAVNSALQELSDDKHIPSDSIRLVFRLYVNEVGEISNAQLLQQKNLNKLRINDTIIVTSIIGKTLPCLRSVYYKQFKENLLPDSIVLIYDSNSQILRDE